MWQTLSALVNLCKNVFRAFPSLTLPQSVGTSIISIHTRNEITSCAE